MKAFPLILATACAASIWAGCATTRSSTARPAKASAAQSETGGDGDESAESPGLPIGKGNAESLAHYAAGLSYQLGGKDEQATDEFYLSVLADPANQAQALDVAKQLFQERKAEKAAVMLEKVCRARDASPVLLLWLTRADLVTGKTNAAAQVSKRAMQQWPGALESYQAQIETFAQAGKTAEMLKVLDRAATHIRREPNPVIDLAGLFAASVHGQDKTSVAARHRAVDLLDSVTGMGELNPAVLEHLADTYAALGQPAKASIIYTNLAATTADTTVARDQLYMKIALTEMDQKNWTNAVAQFQAVVKDDAVRFPMAWYYLGVITESSITPDMKPEEAANKMTEAEADFEHAIRWGNGPELAYYRLSLLLAGLGQGDGALQVLKQATDHFPVSFQSLYYTGMINVRIKDYDEAVQDFDKAAAFAHTNNPGLLDRDFYFELGAACERDHKYDRAADFLKKCIDINPNDSEALNYLGFMWADRGENLPKARDYIEKAVKLEPKNAAYLDSLGWVLYKLKQPRDALPWMLKAVEYSDEPDATILDHLGDVYLSLGETGKAMDNWKKSLSVEENDDVKKKLHLFDAGAT